MAVIQPENVGDFVADTLKNLGKPNFTDISSATLNHVAVHKLYKKNRVVLESGQGIQFNVLVQQSNAARNVSINESDNINTVDGMIVASTVWRSSQTSYQIIGPLMSMNREPARIVDYVLQQLLMAMISLAELMETNFWGAPSASDVKTPLGLPYWVVKNATKGLNGGQLTGFSTTAGIASATWPQWSNWTGPYTSVSRDDFIVQAREAAVKTDYTPPVEGIPTPNTGNDYGGYTNYSVYQQLEQALESQNDNLGTDIASMDGKVEFRNTPVTYVPWLDRDTTGPFYWINWGWFKIYVLSGWWLNETNLAITPGQHTAASHWLDSWYQFVCKNRRANAILSTGTTYPS